MYQNIHRNLLLSNKDAISLKYYGTLANIITPAGFQILRFSLPITFDANNVGTFSGSDLNLEWTLQTVPGDPSDIPYSICSFKAESRILIFSKIDLKNSLIVLNAGTGDRIW